MNRTTKNLAEGWRFWFGTKEGEGKEVSVPHDWVIDAPFVRDPRESSQGFRVRRGKGWYERTISVKKKENTRFFLDFGGIYEQSSVFVNGQYAGGRRYGYSSFRLDVTDLVKDGENQITVEVDCTVTPTDRWYAGAGIYRTVRWIETGAQYLDEREITVKTTFPEGNYTLAEVAVNTHTGAEVSGILSYGKECWETESMDGTLLFHVENPHLWSAEDPQQYQLELFRKEKGEVQDTVSLMIGLRDVKLLSGKGLFVNGKLEKLCGVCLHQDAGCMGIAARKEIWKERLETLKEMGCNAIRTAHHIHSAEFMDLCDELGFYVYEECFDKWTGGHYGVFFQTEWKADLEEMIKRDRNRPSVIIWGVGNEVENQGQDSMLEILKMLIAHIKRLDSSRPVTYAMNPHFKRESKVDISKVQDIQQFVDEADDTEIYDLDEKLERICRIGELVDIVSCNYQEQWYPQIHEAMPDKLILGTEIYQFFQGHPDQFKNYSMKNPSLVPFEHDYVIGGMIWAGIDYLGESMGYPSKGWGGALIRTNGERKPGYYILQSYWKKEPMIHISVMDYSLRDEGVKDHWDIPRYADHWCFPQFQSGVIPYMIASNCEEVQLYVNDSRIYIPKPSECPDRLICGFLPWIPGKVTAIGICGGKEVCRYELVTPGPAVKLKFDRDSVKAEAEQGKQFLMTVRAVDAEEKPCFRESSLVRFRVEGNIRILAVDNGDLMSSEPYHENFIHLYHGCASVMLELSGTPGRMSVYADGDGMESAYAVITV